jgi:hypothetical protein
MHELTHIHFFSWETRISFELPVGFEEQSEDPDSHAAIYADDLDADQEPGARVMTRMTAVPSDGSDACRSMAAASAEIGSRTVESREECSVDGAPAIRQVLCYYDEDAGIDVTRHETHAQIKNVVFSLICLAPSSRSAAYASAFDHASRSARIVLLPLDEETPVSSQGCPTSFAHAGTRISAIVPESWTVTEPTEHSIRFFAPADAEHDGSTPTFSIALGEPDGFGPEGFADFCEASLGRLEQETPGFALRGVERYALSSLVDVHAVWYAGTWESDRELVQLQALGLLDRYHLYLVNAAAPLSLADHYTRVFDGILRGLRVLPSLPGYARER